MTANATATGNIAQRVMSPRKPPTTFILDSPLGSLRCRRLGLVGLGHSRILMNGRYECGGIRVSAGVLGRKRLRLRRCTVEFARQCRLISASYIVASDPVTVRGPEPDAFADWHGHSAEAEDSAIKTPEVFLAQVLRIKFMN